MNITTTILTVGTALRHAQAAEATVHVLLGGLWLTGSVADLDGEGVALTTTEGETVVIRIAGITAVRIERSHEPLRPAPARPAYDGLRFPPASPTDLATLFSVPTPADNRVSSEVSR